MVAVRFTCMLVTGDRSTGDLRVCYYSSCTLYRLASRVDLGPSAQRSSPSSPPDTRRRVSLGKRARRPRRPSDDRARLPRARHCTASSRKSSSPPTICGSPRASTDFGGKVRLTQTDARNRHRSPGRGRRDARLRRRGQRAGRRAADRSRARSAKLVAPFAGDPGDADDDALLAASTILPS